MEKQGTGVQGGDILGNIEIWQELQKAEINIGCWHTVLLLQLQSVPVRVDVLVGYGMHKVFVARLEEIEHAGAALRPIGEIKGTERTWRDSCFKGSVDCTQPQQCGLVVCAVSYYGMDELGGQPWHRG